MEISVKVSSEEFITKELQWYIKAKLPEIVNEYFFKNPEELNKVIFEVTKGYLREVCYELLQNKDIRVMIMEKDFNNGISGTE